jgi:ferritin
MIKESIQEALNKHINAELYSSYLYLSMAAYFESQDLVGMASWMRVQAQEELLHVVKFYDYINDRDGRVLLAGVDGPPTEWESALDTFRAAYDHECTISRLINELVSLAEKEEDRATENFLQWFVGEQVEEEATAKAIVGQLKLVGKEGHGLYMVDKELGTRVFTPPADTAQ